MLEPHVLFVQMPSISSRGRPRTIRSPYLDMCPGRCWGREELRLEDGSILVHYDATNYAGPAPVVAHPPCRAWAKLAHFAKPREGERGLAAYALLCARKFGGVLEHPQQSGLWNLAMLPKPVRCDEIKRSKNSDGPVVNRCLAMAETDAFGGWSLEVDQFRFGHRCEKKTWLYIVGKTPAQVWPWIPEARTDDATHCISGKGMLAGGKAQVSAYEREHTPLAFAEFLIKIATKYD